ncbi:pyridoxamine 5'-phosphate oxidase family protein [Nonomuraea sp. LPB2021202275-12-8]|uniref:pyridoxamine 5'-phosphate oxidase family protein n=1 Tax=Nonomuraea sp. LPB2021202275-12-8 TaxID=3120159 RepID=UPI00300C253E
MTPLPTARTPEQRRLDTLRRLEDDVDAWVATADPRSGEPYMVPLSFLWDGATLLIATAAASATARNLLAVGLVRLGIGLTRDVILVEGTAEPLRAAEVPQDVGDAFAAKTGFDPRELSSPYLYFRVRPRRIQAWREVNELKDRDLMSDGSWHVTADR